MNYLIDGHNLIGKLPDLSLSDPDDEAKLVLKLLNWSGTTGNRIIVVFDGGTIGTNWSRFHSERVKVVFVPQGKSADDWLIRFMRDQVGKNVAEYHLVSSDGRILKQAENRRIPFSKAEKFADLLSAENAKYSAPPAPAQPLKPLLENHQIEAWLELFGGERSIPLQPYQPPPQPPAKAAPARSAKQSAEPQGGGLSPQEVAEWLTLFGGEPQLIQYEAPSLEAKKSPQTRQIRKINRQAMPPVSKESPLSQDDVELWHALFGKQD